MEPTSRTGPPATGPLMQEQPQPPSRLPAPGPVTGGVQVPVMTTSKPFAAIAANGFDVVITGTCTPPVTGPGAGNREGGCGCSCISGPVAGGPVRDVGSILSPLVSQPAAGGSDGKR